MMKFFLSCTAALAVCAGVASASENVITKIQRLGDGDFAPSPFHELVVKSGDQTFVLTTDGAGIMVTATVVGYARYDAPLVVYLNDAEADGTVDEVTYGLDTWHCANVRNQTSISHEDAQRIFDRAIALIK